MAEAACDIRIIVAHRGMDLTAADGLRSARGCTLFGDVAGRKDLENRAGTPFRSEYCWSPSSSP